MVNSLGKKPIIDPLSLTDLSNYNNVHDNHININQQSQQVMESIKALLQQKLQDDPSTEIEWELNFDKKNKYTVYFPENNFNNVIAKYNKIKIEKMKFKKATKIGSLLNKMNPLKQSKNFRQSYPTPHNVIEIENSNYKQ
ncbi:hypothetical protein PPERSA_08195 [Pseudocohnilembus persalinus]|uniref:Uncharacterized protein n=1 Tax=Pseudocohnilembus persalinus TaxID=266149 RepID=A0A0V0R3Q1_PSEPJ|nr:hypothetical protein PPERSA_08195 [Pseudocohnilembus persalinus]|eukprot:KRX08992.1 hypothetical protein PPERSA_08195 [Pseudocohnilembus persalinus]